MTGRFGIMPFSRKADMQPRYAMTSPKTAAQLISFSHVAKVVSAAPITKSWLINTNGVTVYTRVQPATSSRITSNARLMTFVSCEPDSGASFTVLANELLAYASKRANTFLAFVENSHIGKDAPFAVGTCSRFAADSHIGKEMRLGVESFSAFAKQAGISKFLLAKPSTFTRFEVLSQMQIFELEIAEIRVLIPPGGTLVIDSDNDALTATLHGNNAGSASNVSNVLHLYHGTWIRLDRRSYQIDIHAATGGNLETTINYEDRFL